jgi:hypothetical protein
MRAQNAEARINSMQLISDDDFTFERVWVNDVKGAILRATHAPSGKTTERSIGFDADGRHRKELIAEIRREIARQFPAEDVIVEHIWCGPGKGGALRMRHTPTGKVVERVIGYESADKNLCAMFAELLQQLK